VIAAAPRTCHLFKVRGVTDERISLLTVTVEVEVGLQGLLTNEHIHVHVSVALRNLFTGAQLPYGTESERTPFEDD
jgi:hypothetical protein